MELRNKRTHRFYRVSRELAYEIECHRRQRSPIQNSYQVRSNRICPLETPVVHGVFAERFCFRWVLIGSGQ
jgi:hypothetical protein